MRVDRLLAAALAGAAGLAAAAELGTLFHTPAEREKLDRIRRGDPPVPQQAAADALPHTPEVTGFVRRSDGKNTVWIDGRPVATANPKNAPLFDPRAVRDRDLPPSAVKVVPEKPRGER